MRFLPPLLVLSVLPSVALAQHTTRPLQRGERLVSEFNCVACHLVPAELEARLAPQSAPHLGEVAGRVQPRYLSAFLMDPAGTNPMNRMPDLLAGLGPHERAEAVDQLVHFLAGLGAPLDRQPVTALVHELETGRALFHQVGCVACHRPQEEPWELDWSLVELFAGPPEEGPEGAEDADVLEVEEPQLYLPPGTLEHPDIPLDEAWLASKYSVASLASFLQDPLAVRASGRMPDLDLNGPEALAIARYLLRAQSSLGSGEYEVAPGLVFEYFEARMDPAEPDWDSLTPVLSGSTQVFDIAARKRGDNFGFRFSGTLDIPADGLWKFHTNSDDGSWLHIDGREVVDNGGVHGGRWATGEVELAAGKHSIVVTMFEHGGGEALQVEWEGPDVERGAIPGEQMSHLALVFRTADEAFVIDPDKAALGKERFMSYGCATCHTTGIEDVDLAPRAGQAMATAFMDLDPVGGGGCVNPPTEGGHPRIRLDREEDLAELLETLAVRNALTSELPAAQRVAHAMHRMNCYACHRRDEIGGVRPEFNAFFAGDEEAELGDEGRIPPHLTDVGRKLREPWLREVLAGVGRVRPYMTTRMPSFGADNVDHLVADFAAADGPQAELDLGAFDPELVRTGHMLTGTEGLGCIQCHTFGGVRSLGVQAVDLVSMHERIRWGWFRDLLADPVALNMNTRMPSFWPDGVSPSDALGGDPARQIEALWGYLSLGKGMAPPVGLDSPDAAYELIPVDRPLSCGVFMRGVSPRTLVVGFPELAHYAFDMQSSRLAKVWRGRFFNARGTWQGRAGQLEEPPSDDVLDLPRGPAFARLADPLIAWPQDGLRPLGRRLDGAGVPTLRYALGEVTIEETPRPSLTWGGSRVLRSFKVSSPGPVEDLWFRAFRWKQGVESWAAPEVDPDGRRCYAQMDPPVTLRIEGADEPFAVVGTSVDLLVPVRLERSTATAEGWEARFEVEMSW